MGVCFVWFLYFKIQDSSFKIPVSEVKIFYFHWHEKNTFMYSKFIVNKNKFMNNTKKVVKTLDLEYSLIYRALSKLSNRYWKSSYLKCYKNGPTYMYVYMYVYKLYMHIVIHLPVHVNCTVLFKWISSKLTSITKLHFSAQAYRTITSSKILQYLTKLWHNMLLFLKTNILIRSIQSRFQLAGTDMDYTTRRQPNSLKQLIPYIHM